MYFTSNILFFVNVVSLLLAWFLNTLQNEKLADYGKKYSLFNMILLSNLFLNLFGVMFFLGMSVDLKTNILINLSAKLFLLTTTVTFGIFSFYVLSKKLEKYRIKVWYFAFIFLLVFFPIKIIYNELVFFKGLFNSLFMGVQIFLLIFQLLSLIEPIKNIKNRDNLIKIFLIMLGIFVVILNVSLELFYFNGIAGTLISLMLYLTIENPDLKRLQEIELLKEIAEQANKTKTDFLVSISHELRTPLTSIMAFSNDLKEKDDDNSLVKDIDIASKSLLEIVDTLNDMARIESGKFESNLQEYNVKSLFEEIVSINKNPIKEKGLEFKINISDELPNYLFGDYLNLKKVINRIINNCLKFTNNGYISLNVKGNIQYDICSLEIEIEDTGKGMAKRDLEQIYLDLKNNDGLMSKLPSEQLSQSFVLIKKIIEKINGKVSVQSIFGCGTKFKIDINQKIVVRNDKKTVKDDSIKIDVSGKKALIVDDNDLNIKVASIILRKYKFSIDSVNSGKKCIEKLNNHNYDIIFMDDMMPEMSGVETLHNLKKNSEFNIPVVALTANAVVGMKEKYYKEGFDDYLSKPIDKKELERVINKLLNNNHNVKRSSKEKEKKKILFVNNSDISFKNIDDYNLENINKGYEALEKCIDNKYDIVIISNTIDDIDINSIALNLKDIENFNAKMVCLRISDKSIDKKLFDKVLEINKGTEIDEVLKNEGMV